MARYGGMYGFAFIEGDIFGVRSSSNGKSASQNREYEARKKFDAMKKTMEAKMIESTINEAREEGSNSHLQKLPNDALNNVFGYLLGKEFENDENAKISKQISESIPRIGHRYRGLGVKNVSDKALQYGVDFSDLSLFEPANKITISLTLPSFHLTQTCFRDLKKHVKQSRGWDLKQVVSTPAEKELYGVRRKSNAYFVNAIYTVPGTAKKKAEKKASTSNNNVSTSAAFASASVPSTKKRAAPATKAPYKANPAATAALQAALSSAQDGDGVVDPECLKKALSFGFSKAFIDAKVDEQEALNVKPAAKKTKN